jgi:hypothetical protein
MYRRPVYVSLAGWFLTALSVLGMLVAIHMMFLGDETQGGVDIEGTAFPNSEVAIFSLVMSLLTFVSSVNILDGANWARWFYTVICVFLLVLDMLTFEERNMLSVLSREIARGIILICFFLPGANEFFSPENPRL